MGGAVDVAGTGRMALYYGNLNGCTEGSRPILSHSYLIWFDFGNTGYVF